MKHLIKLCLLATLILLPLSCSHESLDVEANNEMLSKKANKSSKSSVHIEEAPDGPEGDFITVKGAKSTLHRNKNGITVNFKTDGLLPGNAYTLWFVVFGDSPGKPSSTHAAGHIVGGSGKGNFSGHISVGDLFDNPNLMTVFNNPLTAEVHIALRTHGPAQPGMIPDQISTIDGGCTGGYPSGPVLYPDSDSVGYCANIQVARHPSVE